MRDESSPPLDYATPPRFQLHPVVPAAEVDQSTLIEAARRYRFLRRQAWRLVLHFLVCFAFFFPQVFIGDRLDNSTRGLLAGPFIVGCLISWVRGVGNAFAIAGFECPRCSQLFGASEYARPGNDRCKHCGLDLGPALAATT